MATKILLTGMHGFAGACFVHDILQNTDWQVLSLERLPTPARPDRAGLLPDRVTRIYHDFRAPLPDRLVADLQDVRYIVHNGAEVHAFRSLVDPELFVHTNVVGTFNLLEAARKIRPDVFLYTSSAEVFGGAPVGVYFNEQDPLAPSNPYAAAKATGEMLVHSYGKSFGMPVMTVRTANLFGHKQSGGKYIPVTTRQVLEGAEVGIHVDAQGNPGWRQWMPGSVYVDALRFLLTHGRLGEVYHVVGAERSNLDVAQGIADILGLPLRHKNVVFGKTHEFRYGMIDTKLADLGWTPKMVFEQALEDTVRWTAQNREWL